VDEKFGSYIFRPVPVRLVSLPTFQALRVVVQQHLGVDWVGDGPTVQVSTKGPTIMQGAHGAPGKSGATTLILTSVRAEGKCVPQHKDLIPKVRLAIQGWRHSSVAQETRQGLLWWGLLEKLSGVL